MSSDGVRPPRKPSQKGNHFLKCVTGKLRKAPPKSWHSGFGSFSAIKPGMIILLEYCALQDGMAEQTQPGLEASKSAQNSPAARLPKFKCTRFPIWKHNWGLSSPQCFDRRRDEVFLTPGPEENLRCDFSAYLKWILEIPFDSLWKLQHDEEAFIETNCSLQFTGDQSSNLGKLSEQEGRWNCLMCLKDLA